MDNIDQLVGIVSGALAILGVAVAVTRYLTKLQEQRERDKIAEENRGLLSKVDSLENRQAQLLDQIALAGRAGSAALTQKASLDKQLQGLMGATGASGGSIYVPVRSPRGDVHGLAFLSIEPFRPQTQVLKRKISPLKSLAGRCVTTGESFVVVNAAENPDHFKQAANLADYKPSTTLNVALVFEDETVGVLQLLSKAGEGGFEDDDVARVRAMLGKMPETVASVTRSPDYLRALGIADNEQAVVGTVLYLDLSRSALLFQELSAAFALQLLNEYFETMCEAGFRFGATVDNYTGDGVLLRFNVPKQVAEHELAAVTAATEMNRAFQDLKEYWVAISPQFASVFNRVGISTGPLLRASLGHSQVQSLTIIGYPIAVAAALCEHAARDRNIVMVGEETWSAVKERAIGVEVKPELLGKARAFTRAAYEIPALR